MPSRGGVHPIIEATSDRSSSWRPTLGLIADGVRHSGATDVDERMSVDKRSFHSSVSVYALEDWIEAARRGRIPRSARQLVAHFETADLQHHTKTNGMRVLPGRSSSSPDQLRSRVSQV